MQHVDGQHEFGSCMTSADQEDVVAVWSCLVYTDVGQASHKDGMQGREWWRSDLAGWSKDGSTSSEANLTKGRFHATSQPSELWLDGRPLSLQA